MTDGTAGHPLADAWAVPDIPSKAQSAVAVAVSVFGAAVKPKLAGPGQPEDQMRGPLETLLITVAKDLGLNLNPVGESSLADLKVRADYAIEVDGALVGYVEVKAPGKGADPTVWGAKTHDRQQWEKIKALPNVSYTDGNDWALYRGGVRLGDVVRLKGNVRTAGAALAVDGPGLAGVLDGFLRWAPLAPRALAQLVNSVAGLCRLLREEVAEALDREKKKAGGPFTNLASDWRELLLPDADDKQFADGYAQTVTFALLLSRVERIDFTGQPISEIARQLGKGHSLMGKALSVLTDDSLGVLTRTIDTLRRVVGAVDWERFEPEPQPDPHGAVTTTRRSRRNDPYLHLYERFLEVYDPELRQADRLVLHLGAGRRRHDRTGRRAPQGPPRAAARLCLRPGRRGRPGDGHGHVSAEHHRARRRGDQRGGGRRGGTGAPAKDGRARDRVREAGRPVRRRRDARVRGAAAPQGGGPGRRPAAVRADTLDNPNAEEAHIFAGLEPIARSRRAANKVKRDEPVVVVIGNPPYRDKAGGQGGWIETGLETVGPELRLSGRAFWLLPQ